VQRITKHIINSVLLLQSNWCRLGGKLHVEIMYVQTEMPFSEWRFMRYKFSSWVSWMYNLPFCFLYIYYHSDRIVSTHSSFAEMVRCSRMKQVRILTHISLGRRNRAAYSMHSSVPQWPVSQHGFSKIRYR